MVNKYEKIFNFGCNQRNVYLNQIISFGLLNWHITKTPTD